MRSLLRMRMQVKRPIVVLVVALALVVGLLGSTAAVVTLTRAAPPQAAVAGGKAGGVAPLVARDLDTEQLQNFHSGNCIEPSHVPTNSNNWEQWTCESSGTNAHAQWFTRAYSTQNPRLFRFENSYTQKCI